MAVDDKKRKGVVYAIFILAVIWGLYNQPWKRPKHDHSPVTATTPAEAVAQATLAAAQATPSIRANGTDAPGWTLNPFRPMTSEGEIPATAERKPESPVPSLQGVMTVGSRQLCVLDGRVYRVGDRVGIWKVVDIKSGQVMLASAEGETLKLSTGKTES